MTTDEPSSAQRPLLTLAWSTLQDRAQAVEPPDTTAAGPHRLELLLCVQGAPVPGLAGFERVAVDGIGVARSRNAALTRARGRYLLFCDDDIGVRLDGAMAAVRYLQRTGLGVALGGSVDEAERPRTAITAVPRRLGLFNSARAATYEMLVDVDAVRASGVRFDQRFGAGAPLPLGDEYVFLADLLRAGVRGARVPWVFARHPRDSSGHRWGSDADAHHRAVVLNRVFGMWAPAARLAFGLKHARRWGSPARMLRFVLDGSRPPAP